VALVKRQSRLLTENIQELRTAFREVEHAHPFTMEAVMILPDHLPRIWTLPEGDDDSRGRQIKADFSRQLPKTERRSKSRLNKGERGFDSHHPGGCPSGAGRPNPFPTDLWQRRFWEHARDGLDYQRHVDYIHYNPVKHGYVPRVVDSPFSSFYRFERLGLYPGDWAGSGLRDMNSVGVE